MNKTNEHAHEDINAAIEWEGPGVFKTTVNTIYNLVVETPASVWNALCEWVYYADLLWYEDLERRGEVPRVHSGVNNLD